MSHEELELIIRKARKLNELRRAKERVKRLERELRGEPVPPEDAPHVPDFLRVRVGARWADRASSDMPCLHHEQTHAMTAADSLEPSAPINRPPAPAQRRRRIENLQGRSRHLVDPLPEPTP